MTPELSNRRAYSIVKNHVATTKKLNSIKICDNPTAYLIDSPGVMVPNIND